MPHDVDHTAILDRIAAMRGGARHLFDGLDPSRTAHVVIDMQNGFMEEGAPVEVPEARSIVDNINRISAAVRDAGGQNIFVRYTTPGDGDPSWSVFLERLGTGAETHRAAFTPGAHYWQLWPGLEVSEDDRVLEKKRFSAFTPGASDLHKELQTAGIDTVIITGTLTNCCCESTARDAMQFNYKVLVVADANAALSDEEHSATLHSMGFIFADVYATDELVGLLES